MFADWLLRRASSLSFAPPSAISCQSCVPFSLRLMWRPLLARCPCWSWSLCQRCLRLFIQLPHCILYPKDIRVGANYYASHCLKPAIYHKLLMKPWCSFNVAYHLFSAKLPVYSDYLPLQSSNWQVRFWDYPEWQEHALENFFHFIFQSSGQ